MAGFELRSRDLIALTCDNLFLGPVQGLFVTLMDWIDVLFIVLGGWRYFKARLCDFEARLNQLGIPDLQGRISSTGAFLWCRIMLRMLSHRTEHTRRAMIKENNVQRLSIIGPTKSSCQASREATTSRHITRDAKGMFSAITPAGIFSFHRYRTLGMFWATLQTEVRSDLSVWDC